MRQLLHFIVDERNVRRVHGNVAAHAAHRNADVGFFQRRRVVYAVADHAHVLLLFAACVDVAEFILRQAVRTHFLDAELPRNGGCGVLVVAGQQHRPHAECAELTDHVGALLAHRVGKCNVARKAALHSDIHHRAPALDLRLRTAFGRLRHDDAVFVQQRQIARKDLLSCNEHRNTATRDHAEILRFFRRFARFLLVAAHNGLAKRVLGKLLRRRAQRVELFFGNCLIKAFHRRHLRGAVGQRAGLVERYLRHLRKAFQRVTLAHQKAVLCRVADGRHDRGRRRQHQRARAEHNKDRHRADDLP